MPRPGDQRNRDHRDPDVVPRRVVTDEHEHADDEREDVSQVIAEAHGGEPTQTSRRR